jgi:hypothetical protein
LGNAEVVNHVFRIENVATQPAERITANDEERQRQGFELQTTFEWAQRDQVADVRESVTADADGPLLRISYGPGATITRLNKGLRRRANKKQLGFRIDPVSGYWAKAEDEDGDDKVADPTASARQWIVPSVQDQKNALLIRPSVEDLTETTLATLQHAFLRGIESVFQLEEGEILAEPMPTRDLRKGFLLYEATEGGAGVLTRLVAETTSFADVAREALSVMHFDVSNEIPADEADLVDLAQTSCVAACYRCLMSYFNQPEHDLLDRRDKQARELLLRLTRSTSTPVVGTGAAQGQPKAAPKPSTGGTLSIWLTEAKARGLPPADATSLTEAGVTFPLVWRDHYVAASLGIPEPAAAGRLADLGLDVIVFDGPESGWAEPFARLSAALGH